MASGTARAVERDRLGRRVVARRQIGLDAMGERVHAGRCRQHRRQAHGEVRVADRALRNEMRRDEAELSPVPERDQRRAADLAAGAGRRRNGDDRRHGLGDLRRCRRELRRSSQAAPVGRPQGDRLGEIDRRAAADGDEAVAFARLVDGDRGFRRFLGRVRRNVVEHRRAAQRRRRLLQPLDQADGDHAGIGDDHRSLDLEVDEILAEARDGAKVEADGGQVADETHGGDPSVREDGRRRAR